MKRKHRNFGDRVQLVVDEVLHLLGHSSSSGAGAARGRSLQLTRLEERVLMSASPAAMVAETAMAVTEAAPSDSTFRSLESDAVDPGNADSRIPLADGTAVADGTTDTDAADATSLMRGIELVVIDSRVQDAETLLSGLLNADQDFRILRLDADTDGIAQITEKLSQIGNVSGVHLLTHGRSGEILLGSTRLNADTLAQHAPDFLAWQNNLAADADLLIYGCDVVESPEGEDFIASLSRLTGADVAASDNNTGHALFGGDWILEYSTGAIEADIAFSMDVQQNWFGVLNVNNAPVLDNSQNLTFADAVNVPGGNDTDGDSVLDLLLSGGGPNPITDADPSPTLGIAINQIDDSNGTWEYTTNGTTWNAIDPDGSGPTTIANNNALLLVADGGELNRVRFVPNAGYTGTVTGFKFRAWDTTETPAVGNGNYANIDTLGIGTDKAFSTVEETASITAVNPYYLDEFDGISYSNNDGTHDFAAGWFDLQDGTASNGRIRVMASGELRITASTGGDYISRQVDLSGATSASLTFIFTDNGFTSGHINVEARTGGAGPWTTVGTINSTTPLGVSAPIDLTPHLAVDTEIRFFVPAAGAEVGVNLGFEAIRIDYTAGAGNTNPAITSDGSGATAARNVTENSSVVTTVTAADADLPAQTLTYSISGGADQAKFNIDGGTGVLTFIAAPDYESPTDAGLNNVYDVIVQVADTLGGVDTQLISVTVTNVYDPVKIYWTDFSGNRIQRSNLDGSGVEDVVVGISSPGGLAVDEAGGKIYWTEFFTGNVRRANLDGSGVETILSGVQGPSGATLDPTTGKIYFVENGIFTNRIRRANLDGSGNENLITSGLMNPEAIQLDIAAGKMYWTDSTTQKIQRANLDGTGVQDLVTGFAGPRGLSLDVPAGKMYWVEDRIAGSDEIRRANLDGTGAETLVNSGLLTPYGIVVNPNEGKVYWSDYGTDKIQRSNLDGTNVENILTGLPFAVNLAFGERSLATNTPVGAIADSNVAANQLLENSSNGAVVGVTAFASDPDLGHLVSYSLDDNAGGRFQINVATGVVTVANGLLLDYESAASHTITVRATSTDTSTSTSTFTIDVLPANDNTPTITSNGGGPSATVSVAENTTVVTTVTASDADLPIQTLTYTIIGGTDASKFLIDSVTGSLTFVSAPDFETPTDANADNVYLVTVEVSDGAGGTGTQALSVTVSNLNDAAPVITAAQSFSVSELATTGTALGNVVATDPDGTTTFGTWQITAGNVGGVFAIDASTGQLTVASTANLNFDVTPGYVLSVTVSDGVNTSVVQTISITVLDSPNTAPVASNDSYTVLEGGTLNQTVVSNWFNSNWQYRQQLAFNNSASATNLIDSAVLVKLHASALDAIHIDYSATQNAGQDLRFVDTDGTVLAYEIERWDESGYSYVWVKVPQIDAGSTTDSIFMYYGNSTAAAGQNASAVWSSNNVAVFHMNSNSSDSTSYSNDGTPTNIVTATGQVARSATFDGLNSSINANSAASVDNIFVGGGAISAWINPVSWGEGGYGRIADKATTTSGALGWGFQVAGTNSSNGYLIFESDFTTNVGRWRTAAGTVALNSWQNVAVVYNNSSSANVPQIYINGVLIATTQMAAPSGTARSDAAQDLYIGNRSGASDRTFSGRIDEIRFSSTAWTADQVKADYKSVAGTLVSSSGVVAGPGGLLENDADQDNDNLTVSLVSGPAHAALFSLNPDGSFNYVHDGSETTTDSFTYRVNDGTLTDTATVSLTITPGNENPIITSNEGGASATISVAENTTAVTTVTATDADLPAQTLTYSISGGADASKFSINSSTGELIFVTSPNFEAPTDNGSNNVYNVTVQVTDGTLTDTQSIAVTVTNANEPPSMTVNQSVLTIPEDAATSPSIEIATIAINDDGLGTNSLTLTGTDASSFQIVAGHKLRLKPGTSLNANTNPLLTVTINLSDPSLSATPISSQTVTLIISEVDEPPTADAGEPYLIFEGDSLTVTAGLSTDPEGLPLTYEWDVDGDGQFDDATGSTATLTWTQLSALTIPVNDNTIRTVALKVTDAGGNATTATSSLTIDDTPPTIIVTGNATTTSGSPYSINIASTDPGNDTIISWHINWGDGTTRTITGTSLTASHTYTVPGRTHSITLTGTDEDGTHHMTGGPLVVNVENNAPTAPTLSDLVVPGRTNGANVGTLSFTDPDAGDSHTWTVSDNRFTVVGTTLKLKPSHQIDPVTEPTVTLTVTVTDAGGLSNASVFTLRVNNPPMSIADAYAVDATQQLSISSPSLGVLANDSDADDDTLTANLVSGPSHAAAFGLNADGTFWYRTASGYSGLDTFTYRATDGENFGALTTVTLTVNQPATIDFDALIWTLPEHMTLTAPLQVGTVGINDDGIGTNTLTLTGPDAALFELDSGNNLFLRAGLTIDFSVQPQFDVTVELDDPSIAGVPDATQRLVFTVQDLNRTPTATSLPDVVVLEDAAPANISTAFAFNDPDGDPLTYSVHVTSQTPGLIQTISIDRTTGIISYSLNANAFGTATVSVNAHDPLNATVSQQFELVVQPVNDAPVVQNNSWIAFPDQTLTVTGVGVLAGATDAENDVLTAILVSGPSNGTLALNADGEFVYTPNPDFQGVDTFRMMASDGALSSNVGTVTVNVIPPFMGLPGEPTSGGSSNSGSQSGTSSSGNNGSTSGGSGSTSSGTSNTGGSTTSNSTSTSGSTSSATGNPDPLLEGILNPVLPGSTSTTGEDQDEEIEGILSTIDATEMKRMTVAEDSEISETHDQDNNSEYIRRINSGSTVHDFDAAFSQFDTTDASAVRNREREILYRQLAERADAQQDSVNEQLEKSTQFKSRVVGSVGVVTTGFSVGYLFWAVRLGTIASGLLAQVPAWSMLDPLLVIDEDQKNDDKESLQNIIDRQQAKMNKTQADARQADNT